MHHLQANGQSGSPIGIKLKYLSPMAVSEAVYGLDRFGTPCPTAAYPHVRVGYHNNMHVELDFDVVSNVYCGA